MCRRLMAYHLFTSPCEKNTACDDNPIQLETTSDLIGAMLESSGKTAETETFLSGEKLLARVREGQGFDLYILDMIMPGMNSMETATCCTYPVLPAPC